MRRLGAIWRDHRHAGAFESLVGIQHAVDERTWATDSGDLLNVLKANPHDYECLDPEQLDATARRFEHILRTLGPEFRIYQYVLKREHPGIAAQPYENPLVRQLLAHRAEFFRTRSHSLYAIDTYFVIAYSGWRPASKTSSSWNLRTAVRQALRVDDATQTLESTLADASRRLAERVDGFVVQLGDGVPLERCSQAEAFRFFRRLLNYTADKSEGGALSSASFVGFQVADSALECHRDHLRLDDQFVQVLSVKEPPANTWAHLFRALGELPAHFVLASEWQRVDAAKARRLIQTRRRHHHATKTSLLAHMTSSPEATTRDMLVDDTAQAQVNELGACLEEIEVHGKALGQFSLTVVLYGRDLNTVRRAAAECFKVFAAHDARVIEERYNLLGAWLAVLPSNHVYNVRRFWLLDTHCADLSFLFSHRSGELRNAHLGTEYLAVLETDGGTPYFLNLHYGDVAHTLVLGATGSGKSFLVNFLVAHLMKYDSRVFIFDLGGSYRTLTRRFGGGYTSLANTARGGSINPFCLPPTAANLHFLVIFCRALIESGGYVLTSAEEKDLFDQIENLYALDPDQRRLLTVARIASRNVRAHLTKWVEGGPYGTWFDNVQDTVTLASFQTLDFDGLADYPDVLEPLVFYILHRANATLVDQTSGQRFMAFVLDEAWRFFRHAAIKSYVTEALKTWRKKGAAVILATQSVDDLSHFELLSVALENCPTKLFLANPGMDRDLYKRLFHLSDTETARIAGLVPKRQFLIKRPDFAKVLSLTVDAFSHELFSTGSVHTHHNQSDPNGSDLIGSQPIG